MQDKIIELLRSTEREGIEDLITAMIDNDFFTAPCSSQYHLSTQEGLALHSYNVYQVMNILAINLAETDYIFDIDFKNAVIMSSILHDLGKMGQFGKPLYIRNYLTSGKISDKKPYAINKELLNMPHESRSVQIAERYIRLTEEESFSILFHNALYGDLKYAYTNHETRLSQLLHFSDMWASRIVEGREANND
jgi:23S rRNA maturation-related 3'-5' exoribonuclease YhaM